MRWLSLCALLWLGALATAGCGSPVASPEDAGHPATDDAGSQGPDAGTADPDAGAGDPDAGHADAGTPDGGDPEEPGERECLAADPPDDEGFDDDCDGAEGTRAVSVYVSADGDDVFGGSPAYPVRTLARAVELVKVNPARRHIFVASAPEPYDAEGLGELFELGASVYGSLSRTEGWSRPEGAEQTIFLTNGHGVLADVTSPLVTFGFARVLSVREPGELHSVGLSFSGQGTVELTHVDIVTDDGADGEDGQDGLTPSPAQAGGPNVCGNSGLHLPYRGGSGAAAASCPGVGTLGLTRGGDGGDGNRNSNAPQHGQPGGEGQGGAGGERGYNPGNGTGDRKGRDGQGGAAGDQGAHAEAHGEADWSVAEGRVFWLPRTEAKHGTVGRGGGGGGGSQDGGGDCANNLANGGAGGGAGGCPGLGGGSGGSGGFSVGIIARGTLPTFQAVSITTGRGGTGGRAAAGGQGALGGPGGISVRSDPNHCGVNGPFPPPDCRAGGNGGSGGQGGDGGHGASGAGGWAIGVLKTGSSPDEIQGLTVTLGVAGEPGEPVDGGPVGASGRAVELFLK